MARNVLCTRCICPNGLPRDLHGAILRAKTFYEGLSQQRWYKQCNFITGYYA